MTTKKSVFGMDAAVLFALVVFVLVVNISPCKIYAAEFNISEFTSPNPERIAEITNKKLNGLYVTADENLGVSAPLLSQPVQAPNGVGYILIGDSRTVQMDVYCKVNETPDNYFVIAASGQGYDYMVKTALPTAVRLEAAHPEISKWKYVICLGVNDLSNADKYYAALSMLSSMKDVAFVSVNPVYPSDYLTGIGYTNEKVAQFNSTMRGVPNMAYIDTFTPFIVNGYTLIEGLHYTGDTTSAIYNLIKTSI